MSELESSWYLRHRDGVEHGPFRLADIVTAAQAGNIAADTCVWHDVHTQGQWVFGARVQPIAQAMPKKLGSAPRAEGPPASQTRQPAAAAQTVFTRPAPPAQTAPTGTSGASAPLPAPAQTADAPTTLASPADAGLQTSIRLSGGDAFPVPKTFLSAAQTLFVDFRFKRFITPWIIKILWGFTLAAAALATLIFSYELFIQPSMPAPGPRTGQGEWQFQPIAGQSFLQHRLLAFALWTAVTMLVILVLRVLFELIIVFFRVSGDVVEFRKFLKSQKL